MQMHPGGLPGGHHYAPRPDDARRAAQTVHVGGIAGLGQSITEEDVADFFRQTGEVTAVRISGRFCWVEFLDARAAQAALQLDGTTTGGHHLRISQSRSAIHSNGLRRKDGPPQAYPHQVPMPPGAAPGWGMPPPAAYGVPPAAYGYPPAGMYPGAPQQHPGAPQQQAGGYGPPVGMYPGPPQQQGGGPYGQHMMPGQYPPQGYGAPPAPYAYGAPPPPPPPQQQQQQQPYRR